MASKKASLKARRQKLAAKLPGFGVLLANGRLVPRNLSNLHYPFRGSSHFIFLFGPQSPNSFGFLSENNSILFVESQSDADAIWDAPPEKPEEICEKNGFSEIRPLGELSRFLTDFGRERVLTLLHPNMQCVLEMEQLLGRKCEVEGKDSVLVDAIIELRLVHDEFALSELGRAQAITKESFHRALQLTHSGLSAHELVAAMEYECFRVGAQTAYHTIATTHGEILHNHDREVGLEAGRLLLIDFGAETSEGYAADVTRTWPVSGKFSALQRTIYEIVLRAQEQALSAVAPGIRYRDIHLLACRIIAEGLVSIGILKGDIDDLVSRGAHALFFPHGVGHLLGLDVHDLRDLGDRAHYPRGRSRSEQFGLSNLRFDRDLVSGMVVTIEPGIYFSKAILYNEKLVAPFRDCIDFDKVEMFFEVRGIRIEDDILVTTSGHENLTKGIAKEVVALESLLAPS